MSDLKELLLNKFKKKDESDETEKIIEVITKILKAIHGAALRLPEDS